MATTFIEGISVRPGRTPLVTAYDSISYITNPEKTENGQLVSSFRCSPETAHFEIMMEQNEYEQETGRKVIQDYGENKKSYMLMSMRQSFAPGEVTPEQAHEIGCKLAERFLGKKYQYVIATHVNTNCIHNHFIFNIVGTDMKKFHQTKYSPKQLAYVSDKLCKEYGLTIVVPSHERNAKGYTGQKETSFRTILKCDIDKAIKIAKDFDEFINIMNENYRVNYQGKFLKFRNRTNGQQRFIRSYKLGAAYTEENIKKRIAGIEVKIESKTVDKKPQINDDIDTLSYSQHLRNIEAMVAADKYINDKGSNFEAQLNNISKKSDIVEKKIKEAQKEFAKTESILKCIDAIERYEDIAQNYETALLKERFINTYQNELELYYSAVNTLKEKGINVSLTSKEHYKNKCFEIKENLNKLQNQYTSLECEINKVNKIRDVVEKVHKNEIILTERKGGYRHGR
jgi:hypothetical protein